MLLCLYGRMQWCLFSVFKKKNQVKNLPIYFYYYTHPLPLSPGHSDSTRGNGGAVVVATWSPKARHV